MINMNDMAVAVSNSEKGSEEVNIAQIKEVLKSFLKELSLHSDGAIIELVNKYRRSDLT